jgi:thiol:disulfide interchange protein
MITMFKTDTCMSCRTMQSFVKDYDVDVVNLSDPDNAGYIERYDLHAVPTFIRFDSNGNEIERVIGAMKQQDFAELVERN